MKIEVRSRAILAGILLLLPISNLFSQGRPRNAQQYQQPPQYPAYPYPSKKTSEQWADSVLKTLTFRQLIGQTLMIPAWSKTTSIDPTVIAAIEKQEVGGIIFFQGSSLAQAYQQNFYQQTSKIPLLIGIDGEWGLAMRLTNLKKFPFQMTLAAAKDPDYCYKLGYAIGKQCRQLGVYINFAPDVDVNTNPDNPIIGFRSLGSDPKAIAAMAKEISRGMEDAGVYSCAKHFPGHGNTKADSHKELPVVDHTPQSLENELFPFKQLIQSGVKSVMVGHLKVPLLDSGSASPASLSRVIIHDLLKQKLGYNGLVITDALNMKGISAHYPADVAGVKALQAGNDILCFPEDPEGIINLAKKYKDSGWIDSSEIALAVRKILIAKHQLGLVHKRTIETQNLQEIQDKVFADFAKNIQLNSKHNPNTAQDYARKSITFLHSQEIIPLQPFSKGKTLVITYGQEFPATAVNRIMDYQACDLLNFDEKTPFDSVWAKLGYSRNTYERWIIINTQQPLWGERSRRISPNLAALLNRDSWTVPVIYCHFGNLYALRSLKNKIPTVLAYENGNDFQLAAIDALFGEYAVKGELPATISDNYNYQHVVKTAEPTHFIPKATPSSVGVSADLEPELKQLMVEMINRHAAEAMQLVVLKNGKMVADINMGHFLSDTLGKTITKSVSSNTIFDLASITKVAATTLAVMKLYEEKRFDLHKPISTYWPEAKNYPWGHLCVEDFLTHRTGMPAFLPLVKRLQAHSNFEVHKTAGSFFDSVTFDTVNLDVPPVDLRQDAGESKITNPIVVIDSVKEQTNIRITKFYYVRPEIALSDSAYMDQKWKDSVWNWTLNTTPNAAELYNYRYSDINFMILGKWVEHLTGTTLSDYVNTHFYKPMGLRTMSYVPTAKGMQRWIAPTGMDESLSRGLIKGYVHDPSAALIGGISGNAGLFSNATDLAKLFYMLSNEGEYLDQEYLDNSTIKLFTRLHSNKHYPDNYRGLGFDKPNGFPSHLKSDPSLSVSEARLHQPKEANVFNNAPESLFGHSGFTGTWAWADPEKDLVFVFLSNRTFPSSTNNLLSKEGYRGKLLQKVYEHIED